MSWTGATPTRGAGRIVTSGAAVMQEIQLIEVSDTEVIRAAHGKSTHTHTHKHTNKQRFVAQIFTSDDF